MYQEFVSEILGSTLFIEGISIQARSVYRIILHDFFYKGFIKDEEGIYIQPDKNVISEKMNICVATVRKYIKELDNQGFIKDVRVGLNKCNKIYLKDRTMIALVDQIGSILIAIQQNSDRSM